MKYIDEKFSGNKGKYILQSGIVVLVVFCLLSIQKIFGDIIIASIGASAFICFTMPHKNASRPRFLIGGYCMGSIAGVFMYFVGTISSQSDTVILTGALSVGLAMLLMVVFNFEHPPAAALALAIAKDSKAITVAFFAIICIVVLSLIKNLLQKYLIDLL